MGGEGREKIEETLDGRVFNFLTQEGSKTMDFTCRLGTSQKDGGVFFVCLFFLFFGGGRKRTLKSLICIDYLYYKYIYSYIYVYVYWIICVWFSVQDI